MSRRNRNRNASDIREAPINFAAQHAVEADAQVGSKLLRDACERVGAPETVEPRILTFDQQLAAIARGARLVEWTRPRVEVARTLGGVSDWGGF